MAFKAWKGPVGDLSPLEAYFNGVLVSKSHTSDVTEEGNLLGVGSVSTSLVDYPKTGPVTVGDYYVDPNSGTNGVGTEQDPFNSIQSALAAVSDGQRILVRAGTINLNSSIIRNTSWTTGIEVFGYGNERPIIDASGLSGDSRALYFTSGQNEHWKGFEFRNGPHRGINISSSFTRLEDVWVHGFQRDGIYVADFGTGTRGNLIQDFAVWNLGDGVSGGTNVPDGCVVTGDRGSPSEDNIFVRGFVANAPDDGFDCYRGRGTRFIDCISYKAGYWPNGDRIGVEVNGVELDLEEQDPSDGNGYKMGGSDNNSGNNWAIGCLSIENAATGFTHNEARNTPGESDPNVVFAFCTADRNGSRGFNTGGDQTWHRNVRRDCIITNNDGFGYVGPNAINLRDISGGVIYSDIASGDYSLAPGSSGIGDGIEGGIGNSVSTQPTTGSATNAGASDVALEIAKEWLAKDLT